MARDNKAAYQRAVERARELGYDSPYQLRKARKLSGITGRTPTPRKRDLTDTVFDSMFNIGSYGDLRVEAARWSSKHSAHSRSAYHSKFSNAKLLAYHKAFVEELPPGLSRKQQDRLKREWLHDYLVTYGLVSVKEWQQYYDPT